MIFVLAPSGSSVTTVAPRALPAKAADVRIRRVELQLRALRFPNSEEQKSMEKHVERYLGVAPVPAHQKYYRGYLIEIAGGGSSWWFTAAPCRPDLPILGARKSTEYSSGIEAREQAIRYVNRLLRN